MDVLIKNPLIASLLIGFVLDTFIGDPHKLPHPIRLFGRLISIADKKLNKGTNKKLKGALATIILAISVYILLFIFFKLLEPYQAPYIIVSSIGVFYGIANHSLIKEAYLVEKILQNKNLEAARKQLSYIVGRETKALNTQQIRMAILETLAENLSDGVVAPLFYYAMGGVPLLFTYKIINTLDSMVGYKSDKYLKFGWFPAKLDDVANYLPARITAFLMTFICLSPKGLIHIFKYGHKHSSPNAGYPEAALSGILDIQLGGPNTYHEQLVHKPYIGKNNRYIRHRDILTAYTINALVAIFTATIITFYFWVKF